MRPTARFRITRNAFASLLLLSTALFVAPLGCSASDEFATVPESHSDPTLPPATVEALTRCLKEGAGRLKFRDYAIDFEVTLNESGAVEKIRPTGKRLDDPGVESCMMSALFSLSSSALPNDPFAEPVSHSRLPQSRAVLGTTALLSQIVRFAPALVMASGTTIFVGVAIIVVATAAMMSTDDTLSEECIEEWDHARKTCQSMIKDGKWRHTRGITGSYDMTEECAKGLVSEACGGNPVERRDQGARPGRRT